MQPSPRWVLLDRLVALGYGVVLVALWFSRLGPPEAFRLSPPGIGAVFDRIGPVPLLCTIAVCLAVALRRRHPLGATATLLTVALVPPWMSPWMGLVGWACVLYAVATTLRVSITIAVLATVLVEQTALALVTTSGSPAFPDVVLVVVCAAGWAVRRRRAYEEELRRRHAEQARAEERLRISRELHDVVAHSMSVITVQAGFGHLVIDDRPEQAREALSAIETTGREALVEMRRLLGVLREDVPAPGFANLEHLLARPDLDVDLEITGRRRELPAGVDMAAYRIVQEALTNVVKHSATTRCRLTVDFGELDLRVEVTDNGRGGSTTTTGHGLVGMRERVELHGGTLAAGAVSGGGFRVVARLPL